MASHNPTHRKAVIGNSKSSSWLYDSKRGFDLTHNPPLVSSPATPSSPPAENAITIKTTKDNIIIDPTKSALVIIDMQNFFLSTDFGRSPDSNGLKAQEMLIQYAIPAVRKAGIRIMWMNWGLTEEELNDIPPATIRSFGFQSFNADADVNIDVEEEAPQSDITGFKSKDHEFSASQSGSLENMGKDSRFYIGLGNAFGPVELHDGTTIDGGRMLMRHQWNTRLTPELEKHYQQGLLCDPPDTWVNKNRLSGFWDSSTEGIQYLEREGIKTLFFAGVNTDQCVWGSWIDAYFRGYDCVLLSDGSATSSPDFAKQCAEFNAANFGFVTDCRTLLQCVLSPRVG